MNIVEKAIKNNEIKFLLEGTNGYKLENDSWASISAPIDWTRVVPLIYKQYEKSFDANIEKMFVKAIVDKEQIDLVIAIDSLATRKIDRLNKVIQITDTGISPGATVEEEIDGWRDGEGGGAVKDAKRLDYIFCNTQKKVKSSKVVCNGKNYPVVSDHYGVMIEVED